MYFNIENISSMISKQFEKLRFLNRFSWRGQKKIFSQIFSKPARNVPHIEIHRTDRNFSEKKLSRVF
jgi:hypothetical protein